MSHDAIARAQLAALARDDRASATARHFAAEMLRGLVTLEVADLCRREVAALLGLDAADAIGARPTGGG